MKLFFRSGKQIFGKSKLFTGLMGKDIYLKVADKQRVNNKLVKI
jgi:hypothetical protein